MNNPYKKLLTTYNAYMGMHIEFDSDKPYVYLSDGAKILSVPKEEYEDYIQILKGYPTYESGATYHNYKRTTVHIKHFFDIDPENREGANDTGVIIQLPPTGGKPTYVRILWSVNGYVAVNNEWYEAHDKALEPVAMTCGGKSDPIFIAGKNGLALLLPIRLEPKYDKIADAIWRLYRENIV